MRIALIVDEVRKILNVYAKTYYKMGVAEGVPHDMQDGEIDNEGWVKWKIIPSHVSVAEVEDIEKKYNFILPPYLSGYLRACYQKFDQVVSRRYNDQLIFMSDCPSDNPLGPLTSIVNSWSPLLDARYFPIAEWGDCWGPMCLDLESSSTEPNDYNIVWFDHDEIISLGEEACSERNQIHSYAKPLYDSFKEFFFDVFESKRS